jgi:hypothetical protein
MYTLREFRANTKKAFDDANSGHEVVIDRSGQLFQLISLINLPLGGSSFESTPKEIKPIKQLSSEFIPVTEVIPVGPVGKGSPGVLIDRWEVCKHGADPSFCKHAKLINGKKVCK